MRLILPKSGEPLRSGIIIEQNWEINSFPPEISQSSDSDSATYYPCDLGQVTLPLCISISSSVGGNVNIASQDKDKMS